MRKLFAALLAVGGLIMMAPQPSQAMSLATPGMATTAKYASEGLITEARFGRGGGGHFGGRHFGGRHFGGRRFGGFRGFHRRHFAFRRAWRPRRARFYAFAPRRRCHTVWTYYGPHRVCNWRRRWW